MPAAFAQRPVGEAEHGVDRTAAETQFVETPVGVPQPDREVLDRPGLAGVQAPPGQGDREGQFAAARRDLGRAGRVGDDPGRSGQPGQEAGTPNRRSRPSSTTAGSAGGVSPAKPRRSTCSVRVKRPAAARVCAARTARRVLPTPAIPSITATGVVPGSAAAASSVSARNSAPAR
jgi:hypothetical protein